MEKKKILRYSPKEAALSVQHLFAMFGATILVPLLTGMNPAVALVTAGIGTLLFHFVTKLKVPVFLGSSFAFIPAIASIVIVDKQPIAANIPYAQFGILFAGLIYVILSVIVYFIGVDKIKKLLPSVVTGPIIVVIGLCLAGIAISDANGANTFAGATGAQQALCWGITLFVFVVTLICTIFAKGFFKLVPILIGMAAGYILCAILGAFGVFPMDYSAVSNAAWFNVPYYTQGFFTLPKVSWGAVLAIAPVALVTFMEHIGDITTNGTVVGKDFMRDPGLHRTVLGDGLATLAAGFLGGPPNTTYSENTGVLATTRNYDPRLLRLTAVIAIVLGFFGKFGAVLQTIPAPVKAGVEIVLFGTIAAIGIRTLAEAKLDFTHSRNLLIVGAILVLGIGINAAGGIPIAGVNVSGLFVATVVGILLNLILPKSLEKNDGKDADLSEEGTKEQCDIKNMPLNVENGARETRADNSGERVAAMGGTAETAVGGAGEEQKSSDKIGNEAKSQKNQA